jgi:large repetitive protein
MAVLNDWQKLTRVLPGRPFGDGADGAYSSATIPTIVYKSCSGSHETNPTTLTASTSSPFEVGDVILIHQSRGTGVGQWEINRIASVGSGEYTLQKPLNYTYTDSGASQAQAIKIPRYTDVTVPSGTWTVTAWNLDVGGILALACNGTFTNSGTITLKGANGPTDSRASGGGYRGGTAINTVNTAGKRGEGTSGAGDTAGTTANGSGGGGGAAGNSNSGGGGGGHSNNGTSGSSGAGGSSSGSADLITMTIGGSGGSGGTRTDGSGWVGGGGGNGGGVLVLFAKNVSAGTINISGGTGGGLNYGGAGGGGAGGSGLFVCETGTFSTSITSTGGTASGSGNSAGGAGSTGRIAIHHSGTITGTTNPTFTDVEDLTLKESGGGGFFQFL